MSNSTDYCPLTIHVSLLHHMPLSTPSDWVFTEPKNVMTVTTRKIMQNGQPILMVARDAEDGSWMFLDGGPFSMEDAMLVTLQRIVDHDSSVCELAGMSVGWTAQREWAGSPWKRSRDED